MYSRIKAKVCLSEYGLSCSFFPLNDQDPNRPGGTESHHCGQWCVVNYNEHTYPSFILAVEREHKICAQEWCEQDFLAKRKREC